MFSPLLLIIGTFGTMGLCSAGNLEGPSLSPLSIVYTVYPYYHSEGLVQVLKTGEPLRVSGNVFPIGRESEDPRSTFSRKIDNFQSPDESSGHLNDLPASRNDSNNFSRHSTEITYWPPVQRGAAPKPRSLGRGDDSRKIREVSGVFE